MYEHVTFAQEFLPLSKLDCFRTSFRSEMDLIIWTLLLSELLLLMLLLLLTEVLLLLRRNDNNLLKMWLGAETVLALRCSRTAERLLRVAISGSGFFRIEKSPIYKRRRKLSSFDLFGNLVVLWFHLYIICLTNFCKFLYEIEFQFTNWLALRSINKYTT